MNKNLMMKEDDEEIATKRRKTAEVKEPVKKILEDYAKTLGVTTQIELSVVETKNDNFLSDISKISLQGRDEKNEPFKQIFVVKEIPKDEKYVGYYRCDVAFKNELQAYNKIIPNLNKFCPKPLPVPICNYSSEDIIILEDLTSNGFEHFDKLTGWTVPLVEMILKEMANLHAGSFIMRQKDAKTFEEITSLVEEVIYRDNNTKLLGTQEKCIDIAIELVKTEEKLVDCLTKLKGTTHTLQRDLVNKKDDLSVINHGDLWANNVLVKDSTIKLLDFQIMRHTSLAADLNYLFYVNLDPKFLDEHRTDLLQYYLKELIGNLEGYSALVEKLTFSWLEQEMKTYAPFGFICGLWISPIFYHNVQVFEKNQKQFEELANASVESLIGCMTPEQKNRLIGLINSYASL